MKVIPVLFMILAFAHSPLATGQLYEQLEPLRNSKILSSNNIDAYTGEIYTKKKWKVLSLWESA